MKAINIKVGDIVKITKSSVDYENENPQKTRKSVVNYKVIALYPHGVLCQRKVMKGIIREFFCYNLFRTGECIWRGK